MGDGATLQARPLAGVVNEAIMSQESQTLPRPTIGLSQLFTDSGVGAQSAIRVTGPGALPVFKGVAGSQLKQGQARVRRLAERPVAALLQPAPS